MTIVRYACSGSIIPGYANRVEQAKMVQKVSQLKSILGSLK